MEYGDPRFPVRFWNKVKPPEHEDDCWLWTGAIKDQPGRTKRYATYTYEGRQRPMVIVVAIVTKPEYDPKLHKPNNTCENENVCARPDHVGLKSKSTCRNGHENPQRDKNYNCKECRRASETRRPKSANPVRRRRPKPVEGFTVFGDKEQTEIWRPPGWSKEPLNGKLSA